MKKKSVKMKALRLACKELARVITCENCDFPCNSIDCNSDEKFIKKVINHFLKLARKE